MPQASQSQFGKPLFAELREVVLRRGGSVERVRADSLVTVVATDDGTRFDWRYPGGEVDYIGMKFSGGPGQGGRYLRNGYQSWSYAGLDTATGPVERSSVDILADLHHSIRRPPRDLEVVGETSQFLYWDEGLAGFAQCNRANGTIYVTPDGFEAVLDLAGGQFVEGDELESLYVWHRSDCDGGLLDNFFSEAGRRARASMPHISGWCSWYQYFHDVDEDAFDANLRLAEKHFGFDLFQLDDGYQRSIGDWLDTNEKFPSSIAELARRVSDAGMIPGIWYAPFVVFPDSSFYNESWLARGADGSRIPAVVNPRWGEGAIGYALDTTIPEVQNWIAETARGFVEAGFRYLKLDFTYAAAMECDRSVPATKAEALMLGLESVRRGAGEQTLLLGCGMPLWPAIGFVDAMRIGQDVAPHWEPEVQIQGLTESLPSTASAYRNTCARAAMHRRLWVNDPDCVMLRRSETKLTDEQIRIWADLVADSGQLLLVSDDLSLVEDLGYWNELKERSAAADVGFGESPWTPPDPFS